MQRFSGVGLSREPRRALTKKGGLGLSPCEAPASTSAKYRCPHSGRSGISRRAHALALALAREQGLLCFSGL